jgi:prepilin-type N-terminal cleavage/methylation domain-containing protein
MSKELSLQKQTTDNRVAGEQGFSLIELVVSMVIFMIVTGSIYGVLQVAQQSRSTVSSQVQLTKNVRLGLNLAGRDTYSAGFGYPLKNAVILRDNRIATQLGIPNDPDTSRDTVPPIIAGNNITLSTFNETPNTRTDQVTFLFKDSAFNLVGAIAGREVSQPLRITFVSATAHELTVTDGSKCRINDLFLITGSGGQFTLGMVTSIVGNVIGFANADVLGFNNPGATNELRFINPVNMLRVKMVTYFVTADGILTRREFANVPPPAATVASVDEPLVYGVEDFQIKYVMEDGSLVDNPSAGADGIAGNADDDQAHLEAVRQIRFTVNARTVERNSRGELQRINMTSTFSTRNLGYDAN